MSYSVITYNQITDPEDRKTVDFLRTIAERVKKLLEDANVTRYTCSIGRSVNNEFNVDGGIFSIFRTQFTDGLSLTCYIGNKKGSASISSSITDDENIVSAVNDAIAAAKAAEDDPAWVVAPKEENKIFVSGNLSFDKDGLFDRTTELMDTLKADFPSIMMEQAVTNHSRGVSLYFNSSGTEFISLTGAYGADFIYSAHDGENSSSFMASGFTLKDLDKPFIKTGFLEDSLKEVEKQVYTKSFSGKKVGKLIAAPALVDELLSSALENFADDYSILNGTSIWIDSLGKKVADDRLTVSFKTNDDIFVGGQWFSSEGYLPEDYNIIDKGILTTFDISAYTANKTGFRRAPNSGSNMIIEKGSKSIEEIIKETDFGIYVARFSGGAPSINGDFSGVAKNSFLIEKGRLTYALSETMISGNLAELLNNIVDISEEQELDGANAIPYICFDGVTVSGE
ncbi:MAG: TldD/PmbA family protein [Clostridia bacterium]|nr:TldD/PmbA family protein [Clostridia bacterium]